MPNNLTPTGATYNTTGRYGQSLNGGSATTTAVLPSNTTFSVEVWAKATGTGAVQVACGQTNAFWLGCTATGLAEARYGTGASEAALTSTIQIRDGVWHCLRIDLTATGGTLYVDGAVAATNAKTPAAASVSISGQPFGVRTFGGTTGFTWGGEVDEVSVWSVAPTTVGAPYVPGQTNDSAANLVASYHLDGNVNDSVVEAQFAVDNANIFWSPANWDTLDVGTFAVTKKSMQTSACGAYLKTRVTGTTKLVLSVDTTPNSGFSAANMPLLMWSIGGGPAQTAQLGVGASTLSLASTLSPASTYTLQVWLLGTVEAVGNRWGSTGVSPTNVLRINGVLASNGATISQHPQILPKRAVFYADSIGEGVRAAGTTTQPADHGRSAPWFLGPALGAEIGVLGYGATGWQQSGSGSMPALPTTFLSHSSGRARSLAGIDYVFVMHGFNGATSQATVQSWIASCRAAVGASAWIFVVNQPGGVAASTQVAAVNAYLAANPADTKVVSIDYSDVVAVDEYNGPISTATPSYGSIDKCHPLERSNGIIGAVIGRKAQAALGGGGSTVVVAGATGWYSGFAN